MLSAITNELHVRRAFDRVLVAEPDLGAAFIEALWEDADGLVRASESLKDVEGDRCTVVRAVAGDERCVVKRYNLRGPVHTATHALLSSRAERCWRNGRLLAGVGLRTARPLAVFEERRGPLRLRSYFVMEFIDGPTLLDEVRAGHVHGERLDRFAEQFGRIWDTLGAHRIGHRDMKASNFIVDDQDRLWMVDLDSMRVHSLSMTFLRRRAKDRERFLRNWAGSPDVASAFRAHVDTA